LLPFSCLHQSRKTTPCQEWKMDFSFQNLLTVDRISFLDSYVMPVDTRESQDKGGDVPRRATWRKWKLHKGLVYPKEPDTKRKSLWGSAILRERNLTEEELHEKTSIQFGVCIFLLFFPHPICLSS
jgi:hypothetical protein